MVNIERLKNALQSRNITIDQASKAMGVNPATMYRRFNRGGGKFTVTEVERLAELLNMNAKDMQDIFFDE